MCGFVHDDRPPLKRYAVRLKDEYGGGEEYVDAHFAFDNGPEGLVIRRYLDNSTRTTIVALYPENSFVRYHAAIYPGDEFHG